MIRGSIVSRLALLEQRSGASADKVSVTMHDGEKCVLLWSEALQAILDEKVDTIEGDGDLYGLCAVMMR